jgi:hypothetical protein
MVFGSVWLEKSFIVEESIKIDLSWFYVRYCKLPLCVEWQGLELEAKFGKRGLWRKQVEIPPWEHRRQKRR